MSREEAEGSFILHQSINPVVWPIVRQQIDDMMRNRWEEDDEGNMEDMEERSFTEESDVTEDEIEMEDSFWTTTIPAEMSFEGEESDSEETNSSESDEDDSDSSASDDEMKT